MNKDFRKLPHFRRMTRLLCLLLALLFCASALVGCKNTEKPAPTSAASGEPKPWDPVNREDDTPCDPADYPIRVSEVMPKSTLYPGADGQASDWVEFYNAGSREVALSEMYFCDAAMPGAPKIAPGGYAVYYVSIPNESEMTLRMPDGQIVDKVTLPKMTADHSYALQEGGFADCRWPTPGTENTLAAYEQLLAGEKAGALRIEEVVVANPEKGGEDWVELYNASNVTLDLSSFFVCDRGGEKVALSGSLAPATRLHLICDGEGSAEGSLPFKLSGESDTFCVYTADGSLSDGCLLEGIPVGGSYGRMSGKAGFFFFADATPGRVDDSGKRFVTPQPALDPAPGCYDGPVTVKASAPAGTVLHYTTDGSKPTSASPILSGSLTIEKPTSLRILAEAEGMLPAEVLTAPYLTDGSHTLPVVCLSLAPDDMWSSGRGIYNQNNSFEKLEHEVNLTIFSSETGNYSADCGISLSGGGSRELKKKSMQLKFKAAYGPSKLTYDLFGDGVEEFDCVKLRAGEDYNYTLFRDELVTEIAGKGSSTLRYQRNRFCVVYVNGEYFGVFCFREKLDEDFAAAVEGAKKSAIEAVIEYETTAEYGSNAAYTKLATFIVKNDMSDPDNYAQVTEQIDVDSLIDWVIAEVFTGNRDYPNERKYKMEDGKWTWILYDMDWSFYYQAGAYKFIESGRGLETTRLVRCLFANKTFRARYLERLGEQLRTRYTPENFEALTTKMMAQLEGEMVRNCERWGSSESSWRTQVETMLSFIRDRRKNVVEQTRSYLSVSSSEAEQYGLQ